MAREREGCSWNSRTEAALELRRLLVATAVAVLAAFASCLGSPLRVVLEVAAAYMAAFLASLGSTLRVFREITFTAAMSSHF